MSEISQITRIGESLDDQPRERPRRSGGGQLVPRRATLDGFTAEVDARGGLRITDLDSITPLLVRTENTVYSITVLEPCGSQILVQGGAFFPEATLARFEGSSFGGSLLKQGWIGRGLRMEICSAGQRILTSRVQSMEIQEDPSLPGPF